MDSGIWGIEGSVKVQFAIAALLVGLVLPGCYEATGEYSPPQYSDGVDWSKPENIRKLGAMIASARGIDHPREMKGDQTNTPTGDPMMDAAGDSGAKMGNAIVDGVNSYNQALFDKRNALLNDAIMAYRAGDYDRAMQSFNKVQSIDAWRFHIAPYYFVPTYDTSPVEPSPSGL